MTLQVLGGRFPVTDPEDIARGRSEFIIWAIADQK